MKQDQDVRLGKGQGYKFSEGAGIGLILICVVVIFLKTSKKQALRKAQQTQKFGILTIFCNKLNRKPVIFNSECAKESRGPKRYINVLFQEDQTLKLLREVRKIPKWSQISSIMKEEFQIFGRNGKQCRERYHNHLDARICKQKWSDEQESRLLSLHNLWGNRWAAISRELPGRTDNCVKNHFYSYFRKCLKTVNSLISEHCDKRIRPLKLGIMGKIVSIIETYHKDIENFDQKLYTEAREIKNIILQFPEASDQNTQNCAGIFVDLSRRITELHKVSRKKVNKKKRRKVQSDQSEMYCSSQDDGNSSDEMQEEQVKKQEVKNEQNFQSVKLYPMTQTPPLKQEQLHTLNQSKSDHQIGVGMGLSFLDQTPTKERLSCKQKNSPYCIINSVDYLDVKQGRVEDGRDEIFIDDEKEWKLFFS